MDFIFHQQHTTVQTAKGRVRGYRYGDVYTFRGIPYAKAKRFRAPEEVDPWEGIRDCLTYGNTCPLMWDDALSDFGEMLAPHRFWPQGEDCQNLNVWTRSIDLSARKPVVVWLHGGGFFAGSAVEMPAYDGHNLAEKEDLVVVTVNHRLNVLGYLDLRKFGPERSRSVNAGNLDLVAALRWVHENIAAFGGDPDNVTIFGQSGGGGKVLTLMQMPAAEGLFHKALVMSGTLSGAMAEDNLDMSQVIRRTLALLGTTEEHLEVLDTVSYPDLVQAYQQAYREVTHKGGFPFFVPMVNEDYPGNPMNIGFSEASKKIPLMMGSTFGEFYTNALPTDDLSDDEVLARLCSRFGTDKGEKAFHTFRETYPQLPACHMYHADVSIFRPSSKEWVQKRAEAGCAPSFLYLFTPNFCINGGLMAWHCSDIPYFFHNVSLVPSENLGEEGDRLEEIMSGAFASFARTGVPCHPELPQWLPCENGRSMTMVLDLQPEMKGDFDRELLDTLAPLHLTAGIFEELES